MNTLILNDETKIVKHNQSNLIENDKKEDVNKNLTQTVDEEKITTVNKDYNIYANEDLNIKVKNTIKQLIEKDFIQRVKGNKITYVEKDVKLKYLQNLFKQIDKDFRIDVKENFHTKANTIKIEAETIELISDTEVNLKGANNNLIVNPNGIFMNAPLVNTNSIYFGAFANEVKKVDMDEPTYEEEYFELVDDKGNIPVDYKYDILNFAQALKFEEGKTVISKNTDNKIIFWLNKTGEIKS